MKKFFLCALTSILGFSLLIGCGKEELKSLTFSDEDIVILKGQDITNLKATPFFDNDNTGDIFDITNEMITDFDKNKTGYQTITVTYLGLDTKVTVLVADKIVNNATELRAAINNQKDGEVIALKAGTYDLPREDTRTFLNNTNFYFLITGNNTIWKGIGDVTVKSSVESPNGNLASQNFVTITGDNVIIDNINLQSKRETNKVIEIYGADATIRNLTIKPIDTTEDFSGSIYLSVDEGTTHINNVVLKYGRITTTGAKEGSKLKLTNVEIDSASMSKTSGDIELSLWGFYNTSNISVTVTDSKITVSNEFKDSSDYESFLSHLPNGLEVVTK